MLKKNPCRRFVCLLLLCTVLFYAIPAYATNDALGAIKKLTELTYSICRAVGVIFLILGVIQLGMSFMEHDPSRRSTAYLSIGGGILVFFVKEIITTITGGTT